MAICCVSEKIQTAHLLNTPRALDFFASLHLTIFERPVNFEFFNNPSMKNTSRSFRLVCSQDQVHDVEALLHAEDFRFDPHPCFAQARTLTAEPVPLGRSVAARFGYIYIQDKSSMLPPLALAPRPGDRILDLCASPGSKTGILSQLVGPSGLVLANEPSPDRLATLRVNMRHLGCFNVATCKYEGQSLPLENDSWPLILLDAPCSGWGTVDKNPKAAQMWAGDKTAPLEALQRELLTKAADLLAPGGRLLYSTCTTNVRENETQVRFAMDRLGLVPEPLTEFAGFSFDPSLPGCLLVNGEDSLAQGFFLAALGKPGRETKNSWPSRAELPGERISRQEFSARTGLDTSWLPEHCFLNVGGRVYLILEQAATDLPGELRWQGFAVGKSAKDSIQADATLRMFVPPRPDDKSLVLERVQTIRELLSGQSLPWTGTKKRLAFYFRSLPLGFLTIKGNRCLWSDR
jgi:16S rRNA (cytosine1407-C5)-methyltransferase